MVSMNKNMSEKLDNIVENIGQAGGPNIFGIPGGSRSGAIESPGHGVRKGNRPVNQFHNP